MLISFGFSLFWLIVVYLTISFIYTTFFEIQSFNLVNPTEIINFLRINNVHLPVSIVLIASSGISMLVDNFKGGNKKAIGGFCFLLFALLIFYVQMRRQPEFDSFGLIFAVNGLILLLIKYFEFMGIRNRAMATSNGTT